MSATRERKFELLHEAQTLGASIERVLAGASSGTLPSRAARDLRSLSAALSGAGFVALSRVAERVAGSDRVPSASRALAGILDRIAALTEDLDADIEIESLFALLGRSGAGFAAGEAAVAAASEKTRKTVHLSIECDPPEMADALESIRDALLHLLRNSVDHGIESPSERRARGKPEAGSIVVRARREGDRLVVDVEDDGRGIDVVAASERARSLRLPRALAPEELIFLPGFSTRASAGELSGRGVGLDAARQFARDLGGELRLARTGATGALFVVEVPLAALSKRVA